MCWPAHRGHGSGEYNDKKTVHDQGEQFLSAARDAVENEHLQRIADHRSDHTAGYDIPGHPKMDIPVFSLLLKQCRQARALCVYWKVLLR